jgi:hypothetical protein
MEELFVKGELKEQLKLFARAAAKGHEESIWILSVWKDVAMAASAVKEAFAKTEEPLGWYNAGMLSDGRERFDFFKKSAEGDCSWGQVEYGWYFEAGQFVEKDEKVYVEWLEKAANQNNPEALYWLGSWFKDKGDENDMEKAVSYYRRAAELGWKNSMEDLAQMLVTGERCEKRQSVIWYAKRDSDWFWYFLQTAARGAFERGKTDDLDCDDFNQLCYSLGWGLYWYGYDSEGWNERNDEEKVFGNRCLDYYCPCVELQQKSIFTFLLCWNQTTRGVKGPGQMIARLVWNAREDNLVQAFGQNEGEEPEMKQIKK